MAAKTFSTFLSELDEVTGLGSGDRIPVLESSTTKYVDGGDIGGGGGASYLKYVALLTQFSPFAGTSGSLNIGETYTIDTFETGDDLTNVADVVSGVINTSGCVFVATGEDPTDWTNGSALSAAGNPIATVLENTLGGTVVWSYDNVGSYIATLAGAFTENKTMIIFGSVNGYTTNGIGSYWADADSIGVETFVIGGSNVDEGLENTPIEIRVYP